MNASRGANDDRDCSSAVDDSRSRQTRSSSNRASSSKKAPGRRSKRPAERFNACCECMSASALVDRVHLRFAPGFSGAKHHGSGVGGTEALVVVLAEELASRGIAVTVGRVSTTSRSIVSDICRSPRFVHDRRT